MVFFLTVIAIISGLVWLVDYSAFRAGRKVEPLYLRVVQTVFPLSIVALLLATVNFELLLTLAVLLSAVIYFLDLFWLKKRRRQLQISAPSVVVEYGRSFFPILLIVLVIRSFVIQPVRVPTGSLEPTVMPGDLIAVSEFAYGLRLPVIRTKIYNVGEPKIGDIVVFRWPVNPNIDFVKRVIGTPGDHIEYKNKTLYINGKQATQTLVGPALDVEAQGNIPVEEYTEDLNGVKHQIFINPHGGDSTNFSLTVPDGHYFMMGDNRDNSDDSRTWGFVPEENLRGKALVVWMSWDPIAHRIRWNRIGNSL